MKQSARRFSIFILFGLISFCCTMQYAYAHKVTVFAWQEGDRIFTESRFSGGKRVKSGHIDVYDASGRKILQGKTDEQGFFSFKDPGGAGIDIVLKAGAGHQARWTMSNEVREEDSGKSLEETKLPEGVKVSPEELKAIVENVLDEKLKPILAMMRAQQSRDPSMTDIMGGIGYIFGLTGVAAWFSARKRKGRQGNE